MEAIALQRDRRAANWVDQELNVFGHPHERDEPKGMSRETPPASTGPKLLDRVGAAIRSPADRL